MDKKSNKKTPKKKSERKVLNTLVIIFLSFVMIGGIGAFFLLNDMLRDATAPKAEELIASEPTRIYDADNNVIKEVGLEVRENIQYEQLPQSVIDAFLAIEDSRFFSHNGFDLPRFIMSFVNNIKSGSLSQGGSTLTMQFVDNFITAEKSDEATSFYDKIKLKVQEIFFSMDYEKALSKEEIFATYVNKINFGSTARGIQRGAEYYFGKSVEELTLSESAFLAGVINAPNANNPYYGYVEREDGQSFDYYQNAVKRRNETLAQMLNHGYITEDEYYLAKNTELAFQLNGEEEFVGEPYEDYVTIVMKEALEVTGLDPATVPMDIYTSMDPDAQKLASDIQNGKSSINVDTGNELYQLGFVAMNNQTGEVVAVGNGFNNGASETTIARAIEQHQPGSTMKPLLSYAPAFDELGWATTHALVDDDSVTFGPGLGPVVNSDGKYDGEMDLAKALGVSKNVPAVKAFQELLDKVGYSGMREYLANYGFNDTVVENLDLQYCIGGSNMTASAMQMAGAYSSFANQGEYIKPHTITKIVFRNSDQADYEFDKTAEGNSNTVVSPQAAYMISNLLEQVVSKDWGNLLYVLRSNYPVYGKSGTSDWGQYSDQVGGRMKDEWMVSYTSNYTIATWSGFDRREPGAYISDKILYANIPGKINKAFQDLLANGSETSVKRPDGISSITHLFGKYPYVAAPENADDSLVRTGLIKSEFNKLGTYEAPKLQSLTSFSATAESETSNKVNFAFAEYPDQEWQNQESSESKTFGKAVYCVDVKVNGTVVDTLTFDSPNASAEIEALTAGATVDFVGYYSYANVKERSNEMTSTITRKSANRFMVTTSSNEGGVVTPGGEVEKGQPFSFTVTPNEGYTIQSVIINGQVQSNIQPNKVNTIKEVNTNITIQVVFTKQ